MSRSEFLNDKRTYRALMIHSKNNTKDPKELLKGMFIALHGEEAEEIDCGGLSPQLLDIFTNTLCNNFFQSENICFVKKMVT